MKDEKEKVSPVKRRKAVPIVIPNAEALTPEELAKAKDNEKHRRKMAVRRGNEPGDSKKTKNELKILDTNEMVALAKDTRNIVLQTLNRKIAELYNDPEALSKVNLATLATTFGIMFDKGQLMDGMSTQNIAISQKIDITMTAASTIEELHKMREGYTEENK
jgi:hypothetical protein